MRSIARRKLATYIAEQLQAGKDVKHVAKQAVAYLAENKQLNQVELLIRDVEAECAAQYGVVTARVTSAHPLEQATRKALEAFVKEAENANRVVVSEESIDPELIGGVIMRTPNSVFDSSIKSKLRQLTATTKEIE